MSKTSKICLLVAFLLLIVSFVLRFIMGTALPFNSVLLGLAGAAVLGAVFFDRKLYWQFFTMRTTKHGMNMGVMILLSVFALVCVNYIANKRNKTWDLTKEKLNSLSDQSEKLLESAKGDIEVKVFYLGPEAVEIRQQVKQNLKMFQEFSSKVKVNVINAYTDQGAAIEYLNGLADVNSQKIFVFVEYNGKRIRVEEPFDEAALTSSMIKATRERSSKVYFLTGHGEKEITSQADQGIEELAKQLRENSYQVEPLNLIEAKGIPEDAALVAIVGPRMPYLEPELEWLREYLKKGGRMFVALDPGERHNLANLTKSMGVQFANNYILNLLGPQMPPTTALGRYFDQNSEITKTFPNGSGLSVFSLSSEVTPAVDKPDGFEIKEIVKTDPQAFAVGDLSKGIEPPKDRKALTLGVVAKGKVNPPDSGNANLDKPFEAVIFGDSDFLSNQLLAAGYNRDLVLNSIAFLSNQSDLISIKPKIPAGSIVTLTGYTRLFVIIAALSLPILLLISSSIMWARRRGA